jgi:hypothetical protein
VKAGGEQRGHTALWECLRCLFYVGLDLGQTADYTALAVIQDGKKKKKNPEGGLAGRLRASLWSVPLYDMFALLHVFPKLVDVVAAANELHMWYSQLPAPVNHHQADRIKECRDIISKRLGIEQRLQVISVPFIPRKKKFTARRSSEITSRWPRPECILAN